jgi:hypothetical protein
VKENVGGTERVVRSIAGPALVLGGLTVLGARQGKPAGLGALALGAVIAETAMAKTCAFNGLIGRDSAH